MSAQMVTVREMNGITVIRVQTEKVYQNEVPAFRQALQKILKKKPQKVVVDLSVVTVMNSSGLGALIAMQDDMEKRRGRMVVAGLCPMMAQLFEKMRLNQLFTVAIDQQEAFRAL